MATRRKSARRAAKDFELVPKAATQRMLDALKLKVNFDTSSNALELQIGTGTKGKTIRIPRGRECFPFSSRGCRGDSFFKKIPRS